jgi:hypothetical protein
MTAESTVPQPVAPEPARSVFESECPRCGAAMRPETGWIWTCPSCAFHAERVAGTLLELPAERAPNGGTGAASERDVTPNDLRSPR